MSTPDRGRKGRLPTDPVQLALSLAGNRSLWEPLVAYDPTDRYYTRLARDTHFEAWLLTWLPGQGTEWHDHGGSAGAFVTVQGALHEEHATLGRDGLPVIAAGVRHLSSGALRAFGRQHIHRVRNVGLEPAVSVHVYAPSLVAMNRYDAGPGMAGSALRLVESQLVGVDW